MGANAELSLDIPTSGSILLLSVATERVHYYQDLRRT
jgi:hypothetical protein